MSGWGKPLRCKCLPPFSAKLGATWECPDCAQLWKYAHDNIASCFWVHAGWFKRLARRIGGSS